MPQFVSRTVKRILLGGSELPQEFTVGLEEPQSEVSVWLHGLGPPCDVTFRYTTAASAPLTLCLGLDPGKCPSDVELRSPLLQFRERGSGERILGEIRLVFHSRVSVHGLDLLLFRIRSSANYCLPRVRLWTHYFIHARAHRRRNDPPDIRMTLAEERAAMVTFIRPHFLYLVSLGEHASGNIFPMNLTGELGNGYIGFALREQRLAANLVQHAGRIAFSGVPLTWCSVAIQLAGNHKKSSVNWHELPFDTTPSTTFGIPVPDFATKVREVQVELVHKLGSHRLFVARVVSEIPCTRAPQACVIHGFYQYWRTGGKKEVLQASLAAHTINKPGAT